jgi:hypothetical protein
LIDFIFVICRSKEDERFLKELFENLKSPNIDDRKRCDIFQFLREFITFSHGLQQTREALYKVKIKLFEIVPMVKQDHSRVSNFFKLLYDQGILSVLKVALVI